MKLCGNKANRIYFFSFLSNKKQYFLLNDFDYDSLSMRFYVFSPSKYELKEKRRKNKSRIISIEQYFFHYIVILFLRFGCLCSIRRREKVIMYYYHWDWVCYNMHCVRELKKWRRNRNILLAKIEFMIIFFEIRSSISLIDVPIFIRCIHVQYTYTSQACKCQNTINKFILFIFWVLFSEWTPLT